MPAAGRQKIPRELVLPRQGHLCVLRPGRYKDGMNFYWKIT